MEYFLGNFVVVVTKKPELARKAVFLYYFQCVRTEAWNDQQGERKFIIAANGVGTQRKSGKRSRNKTPISAPSVQSTGFQLLLKQLGHCFFQNPAPFPCVIAAFHPCVRFLSSITEGVLTNTFSKYTNYLGILFYVILSHIIHIFFPSDVYHIL